MSFLGYLLWGFSDSLVLLFASRIVAGLGNANIAVAQAYISDVTTPENRAKGMGLIGAAFGLGFVMGPAIGGGFSFLGYNTLGFIAAAFSILDFVLAYFLLREPEKRSRAGHERYNVEPGFYLSTLADKHLRLPLAIFFISTFAFANMETTLVLLAEHKFAFSASDNAYMFTFIGFIMVLVQGGLIGRLSKAFGEKALVIAGCVIVSSGLLLTAFSSTVPLLYGAVALLAIGSGINNPSNQSILSRLANEDRVGGVLGVGQSMSTLGRILGPVVGGALYSYVGQSSPYVLGSACMLFACLLALFLPQLTHGEKRTVSNQAESIEVKAG
jgi:DHA1 family tetracycline resistance protein-like MFS transporter